MTKQKPLAVAAAKVAAAKPKTPSALLTVFRSALLPFLPTILSEVLKADKKGKYSEVLREARDVLANADLGDDEVVE